MVDRRLKSKVYYPINSIFATYWKFSAERNLSKSKNSLQLKVMSNFTLHKRLQNKLENYSVQEALKNNEI